MLVEGRLVADDALLVLDTATDALEKNAWQALLRESLRSPMLSASWRRMAYPRGGCEQTTAQQANDTISWAEVFGGADRPASHLRRNRRCSGCLFESQHKCFMLSNSRAPLVPAIEYPRQ